MPETRDDNLQEALDLERYMIPHEQWDQAPVAARLVACQNKAEGVPTGICKHPTRGYFVISTAGQGPMIDWSEQEGVKDAR